MFITGGQRTSIIEQNIMSVLCRPLVVESAAHVRRLWVLCSIRYLIFFTSELLITDDTSAYVIRPPNMM